jgi:hypothetical protein
MIAAAASPGSALEPGWREAQPTAELRFLEATVAPTEEACVTESIEGLWERREADRSTQPRRRQFQGHPLGLGKHRSLGRAALAVASSFRNKNKAARGRPWT